MKRIFLLILSIILLTIFACTPPPERKKLVFKKYETAFNEADFLPFSGAGTGKVIGQAFLKTRGGDIKYGAGNEVYLIPWTPYTAEIYFKNIQNRGISPLERDHMEQPDQRYFKYRRTTIADGVGNFEFDNIPPGEYLLETSIYWEVPQLYGRHGYMRTTGGAVDARISVKANETIKVILTK